MLNVNSTTNTIQTIAENTHVITQQESTELDVSNSINTIVNDSSSNDITVQVDPGAVLVDVASLQTVTVGIPGPAGPAAEDLMPNIEKVDFNADQSQFYKGEAAPGSLSSSAVWRISNNTINATDSDYDKTYANVVNGQAFFNSIWDDRASLVYS